MSEVQVICDTAMCIFWIATYTLVLIGMVKYRYPLISPITQAIIAPFEFSVLFLFVKLKAFRLDYASLAYLYWSIIEMLIIAVMIKHGSIQKKYHIPWVALIIVNTAVMTYFVTLREEMFFFSYLNTIVGMIIWLGFLIQRKDYPIKPLTLAMFLSKFIADILGYLVYYGTGNWIENMMCVLLPVVDIVFLIVFCKRRYLQRFDN